MSGQISEVKLKFGNENKTIVFLKACKYCGEKFLVDHELTHHLTSCPTMKRSSLSSSAMFQSGCKYCHIDHFESFDEFERHHLDIHMNKRRCTVNISRLKYQRRRTAPIKITFKRTSNQFYRSNVKNCFAVDSHDNICTPENKNSHLMNEITNGDIPRLSECNQMLQSNDHIKVVTDRSSRLIFHGDNRENNACDNEMNNMDMQDTGEQRARLSSNIGDDQAKQINVESGNNISKCDNSLLVSQNIVTHHSIDSQSQNSSLIKYCDNSRNIGGRASLEFVYSPPIIESENVSADGTHEHEPVIETGNACITMDEKTVSESDHSLLKKKTAFETKCHTLETTNEIVSDTSHNIGLMENETMAVTNQEIMENETVAKTNAETMDDEKLPKNTQNIVTIEGISKTNNGTAILENETVLQSESNVFIMQNNDETTYLNAEIATNVEADTVTINNDIVTFNNNFTNIDDNEMSIEPGIDKDTNKNLDHYNVTEFGDHNKNIPTENNTLDKTQILPHNDEIVIDLVDDPLVVDKNVDMTLRQASSISTDNILAQLDDLTGISSANKHSGDGDMTPSNIHMTNLVVPARIGRSDIKLVEQATLNDLPVCTQACSSNLSRISEEEESGEIQILSQIYHKPVTQTVPITAENNTVCTPSAPRIRIAAIAANLPSQTPFNQCITQSQEMSLVPGQHTDCDIPTQNTNRATIHWTNSEMIQHRNSTTTWTIPSTPNQPSQTLNQPPIVTSSVTCAICRITMPSMQQLQRHFMLSHSILKCPYCPFKVTSVNQLKMHCVTMHAKNPVIKTYQRYIAPSSIPQSVRYNIFAHVTTCPVTVTNTNTSYVIKRCAICPTIASKTSNSILATNTTIFTSSMNPSYNQNSHLPVIDYVQGSSTMPIMTTSGNLRPAISCIHLMRLPMNSQDAHSTTACHTQSTRLRASVIYPPTSTPPPIYRQNLPALGRALPLTVDLTNETSTNDEQPRTTPFTCTMCESRFMTKIELDEHMKVSCNNSLVVPVFHMSRTSELMRMGACGFLPVTQFGTGEQSLGIPILNLNAGTRRNGSAPNAYFNLGPIKRFPHTS